MIFGLDPQTVANSIIPVVGRILVIIVIALVAQNLASHFISRILKLATARHRGEDKEEFDQRIDTISSVFTATASVIIWGLALFTILSEIGINIAPILTGAGIAGLAVGFGAQNLVRDFIAGLFVLLENQYTKGDIVKIANLEGEVEEVNLRRTVLRDLDGTVHNIPNGEIKTASNLTQGFSKINLNLLVEGIKDTDQATKLVDEVGQKLAKDTNFEKSIVDSPKVLRVEELAKEGIVLKIIGTTRPTKQWEVLSELRKRLKKAFDEQKIVISEKESSPA